MDFVKAGVARGEVGSWPKEDPAEGLQWGRGDMHGCAGGGCDGG